jgi:hypothetical protein
LIRGDLNASASPKLSFRPERADAFSSRSLPAIVSARAGEESLFDRSSERARRRECTSFSDLPLTNFPPAKNLSDGILCGAHVSAIF